MDMMKSFIDSYLNFPYGLGFVIAVAIFSVLLFTVIRKCRSQGQSISRKEVLCCIVLSIYIVIILGGTLLNRTVGEEYRIEFVPFWSYYEVATTEGDGSLALQILYNVLVFIPWGILMPQLWGKLRKLQWLVVSAAVFSFLIEIAQFMFKLGLFEFDDIFHNVFGAVSGYAVWKWWKKGRKIR